ncbi:adenylate cyclase type 10-like [Rhinatrema bivittatum]|uniref:adenylate cyclase type 10-like n=1 Tax=Rhinatrema bivittatum TaxID=194408 RepID=UPI00112E3276|nr:adenylate cyclase type 10-like [Rhinatrema bivittatum]
MSVLEAGHLYSHKIGKVAAHVPDLVVYGNHNQEIPYVEDFNGVLLFADISGFTALTETFSRTCKKGYGADQLTRSLNKYIGDIVHHVLMSGGDILNFAGDALLALWKVERKHLSEVITLVAKCCMDIQEDCGVRDTKVGIELRVKIGISAGRLSKVVIGFGAKEYFVVLGRAVDEVRLAEGLAGASEIILSPNAWELCDRTIIATEKIENERAVKLQFIKEDPEFDLDGYIDDYGSHLVHEDYADEFCRKASGLAPQPELEAILRRYLLGTVLQKIDDGQPLEYLSEMRPVTILFLNLQFMKDADVNHQCSVIQGATWGITHLIQKYNGKINKIFMFDKGCTVLCLFGLPGDKQDDECSHALRCAFQIQVFCSEQLLKVRLASIGVTNGPVFCGVVGHPFRHEYTVIGRKVNLGARMMIHYPGIVSCDEETYRDSKLPPYFFNELPSTPMKGVTNPGTLYQYLGNKEKTTIGKSYLTTERNPNYPLLGREKEIEVFTIALKRFLNSQSYALLNCHRAIVYEGPIGYGKSMLLAEINYLVQKLGQRVVALELAKMNRKQSFYTMQTMMAMFFRIDVCKGYAERERVLQNKISDPENEKLLCLLNSLFLVKFPFSREVSLMDPETIKLERNKFLNKVLKQATEKEYLVLIIDQAHYIDKLSWDFLAEIFYTIPIFLVMAQCPCRLQHSIYPSALKILKSKKTFYIHLKELSSSVIPELACQTLGVVSIPKELELLLIERSYGIPYYCEELLKSLYFNNLIQLLPLPDDNEDDLDALFMKPQNFLKRFSGQSEWKKRATESHKSVNKWQILNSRKVMSLEEIPKESMLFTCYLSEAGSLQNFPLPFTLKGIALAQLDCMSPTEQIVVKCAAVIGQTFSTKLLHFIIPQASEKKLAPTLMSLVKSRIIECAAGRNVLRSPTLYQTDPKGTNFCFCDTTAAESDESELDEASEFQKSWPCRMMRFCTPLLQETTYELWLREQIKTLHFKCTNFLEMDSHKCSSCGGGDFIFGHYLTMDIFPVELKQSIWEFEESIHESPSATTQVTTALSPIIEKENELEAEEEPLFVEEAAKFVAKMIDYQENLESAKETKEGPDDVNKENVAAKKPKAKSKTAKETIDMMFKKDSPRQTSLMSSFSSETLKAVEQLRKEAEVAEEIVKVCLLPVVVSHSELHSSEGSLTSSSEISNRNMIFPDVEPSNESEFLDQLDWMLDNYRDRPLPQTKNCRCAQILDSVTAPLARHWRGVGNITKTLYYLLESAAAALYLSNNYMAHSFLNEASSLLDFVKNDKNNDFTYDMDIKNVKIPRFEKACLFALKGEVFFNNGQFVQSEDMLKKALQQLHRSFPHTIIAAFFKLLIEKAKISMLQRKSIQPTKERDFDEIELPYIHQQIHCLALLWQIYSMSAWSQGKLRATLAVVMQVNCAEKSRNEAKIISSYMDYFQCCQILGSKTHYQRFEIMAIQRSAHLPYTKDGISVLCRLAYALANTHLCSGRLMQSIKFGYRAHHLASLLNQPSLDCAILPALFTALILCNRYSECVIVIRWLEKLKNRHNMIIISAWYYTFCLDLLLQCGFHIQTFDDCLDFVEKHQTNTILMSEIRLLLNLYASLALWFARLEDWDLCQTMFRRAKKLVAQTNASFFALYGFAKFLECHILMLRKAVADGSENQAELFSHTLKYVAEFKSRCSTTPVFFTRLYHLKGFVFMLTKKPDLGLVFLQKAFTLAEEHGNKMEEQWIALSAELWFGGNNPPENLWGAAAVNMPHWREISDMDFNTLYKTKYLLELPTLLQSSVKKTESEESSTSEQDEANPTDFFSPMAWI